MSPQPKVETPRLGERVNFRLRKETAEALPDGEEAAAIRGAMQQWADANADAERGDDLDGYDTRRRTLRVASGLLDDIDTLVERGVAPTRSRAIREAVREYAVGGEA